MSSLRGISVKNILILLTLVCKVILSLRAMWPLDTTSFYAWTISLYRSVSSLKNQMEKERKNHTIESVLKFSLDFAALCQHFLEQRKSLSNMAWRIWWKGNVCHQFFLIIFCLFCYWYINKNVLITDSTSVHRTVANIFYLYIGTKIYRNYL